ncbi:hypothetical protein C8F01DRAFT_1140350 [Mycena amicta]|nr:hypothetical protein C8F01DRAFT_1140350 [Mycena amicta]
MAYLWRPITRLSLLLSVQRLPGRHAPCRTIPLNVLGHGGGWSAFSPALEGGRKTHYRGHRSQIRRSSICPQVDCTLRVGPACSTSRV